jgi:hypothetical protein
MTKSTPSASSILQDYLNKNLISIVDDGDFKKLQKTASEISKKLLKEREKIPKYTLAAIDPNVSPDNPQIMETKGMLIENWKTFTSNVKDTPLTYIRGIMLDALHTISVDINNAVLIWFSGRNIVKFGKLSGEEKDLVFKFIAKCGDKINREANESWTLSKKNPTKSSIELKRIESYLINNSSLQKYMEDAAGPHNSQRVTNFESPNPSWPNSGAGWSFEFAPRAAKAIKAAVDSPLKLIVNIVNENSNIIQKSLNEVLDKGKKDMYATTVSLQLRSELLWWKESCYSQSMDHSYRNLTGGVKELAIVKDYSSMIPVIYPKSVDYFLSEVYKGLNDKLDEEVTLKDALHLFVNASAEIQEAFTEMDQETGKVSLLNFVSGIVWNKCTMQQLESMIGVSADTKISLADCILWLFHDLQLVKALNSK